MCDPITTDKYKFNQPLKNTPYLGVTLICKDLTLTSIIQQYVTRHNCSLFMTLTANSKTKYVTFAT